MGFDNKNLQTFLTLCEKLNFRETSNIHYMECSTLSRLISRMEAEMNATFFIRNRSNVELTEQGIMFRRYAKSAVNRYQNIYEKLNNKENAPLEGEIKIASAPTLASVLLPKITSMFMEKHPSVSFLKLVKVDWKDSANSLEEEKMDFLLQSGGGIDDERTVYRNISETPLVLICKKDNREITSLEQLNDVHFFKSEYADLKRITENIFYKSNVKPKKLTHINGHEAICEKIASSDGYAFLPKVVVDYNKHKDNLLICSVTPELPTVNIAIRMKKRDNYSRLHKTFWNFISELEYPMPID